MTAHHFHHCRICAAKTTCETPTGAYDDCDRLGLCASKCAGTGRRWPTRPGSAASAPCRTAPERKTPRTADEGRRGVRLSAYRLMTLPDMVVVRWLRGTSGPPIT